MGQQPYNRLGGLLLSAAVCALIAQDAEAASFGVEVVGNATVSYRNGQSTIINPTNDVRFTIVPPQVTPEISFFRHNKAAPQTQALINGSDFSPTGSLTGAFSAVDRQPIIDAQIDLQSPVPLSPVDAFVPGELLFAKVSYITANTNSNEIETFTVKIEGDNGDTDILRLYESGPDTGEFWGFVPLVSRWEKANDGKIATNADNAITLFVEDNRRSVFGASSSVGINPVNFVFNSVTGDPVDGAQITLIDLSTGEAASVLGVDRQSVFPNRVVSGVAVTDASGLVYDSQTGVFCFPFLEAGRYAVEVIPPEGYAFASGQSPDFINQATGGGYYIIEGSFGRPYEINTSGPLKFDIPLDPVSDFNLKIEADRQAADIGDPVTYTVTVENVGTETVPLVLHNLLPDGFRYIAGTINMTDRPVAEPTVDPGGLNLTMPMGVIDPNETLTLRFSAEVGPGAGLGQAINSGVILSGGGQALSNKAQSTIRIQEDLLRSKSTIVGRISSSPCLARRDWTRGQDSAIGVEGVRIYMETGAYAVSDADGLFHFEAIEEGAHVVQIDEQSVPDGYEIINCEQNTRFAGSRISQFVDVQGGGIWRANFYLRPIAGYDAITSPSEDISGNEKTELIPEYAEFNGDWLASQNNTPEWVYPNASVTPSKPSINIGIKHPVDASVTLYLNGKVVKSENLVGRDTDKKRSVMITRWKGVDILSGVNSFSAVIRSSSGEILKTVEQDISYVSTIARASIIAEQSSTVADGRTRPVVAIRLEDESGKPVHAGRETKITIDAPYKLYEKDGLRRIADSDLGGEAYRSAESRQFVGHDGTIKLELEPTLQTGRLTAHVTLDNGRVVPVQLYMKPEKRDWVIVGLATGSVGYEKISKNMIPADIGSTDLSNDGRVAFFAKGLVKGEWLMTLSVDTDKRRRGRDGDFLTQIDPNAYYTLYGDRSDQRFDGTSRYPIYVKLERDTAYALFGDFSTDITEPKLTPYNRQLSGLQAGYQGEKAQLKVFAAETNQGFAKDELPADGTSGTYRLSRQNILAQSETVIIETRDRIRPDVILERRVMQRFRDYTLDYLSGELIFKFPVDVSDADFNPNVIIVDYETSEEAERNITFGGRAQAQVLGGKLTIGTTAISQDGSSLAAGTLQRLIGVDAVAHLTDNTEVRAEYAISDNNQTEGTQDAMLAELIHTSEKLSGELYYREEQAGFGLGQTNSNTNSVRRYGARGALRLSEFTTDNTSRRGTHTVEAAAYHEDNLSTGDSRDTAEVTFRRQTAKLGLTTGLRGAQDKYVSRDDRQSILALAQVDYAVPKFGANFQISHEQPLSGKDQVSVLPQRTRIGVDKTLGPKATVNLRHEILKGATTDAQNTSVGLTVTPWSGSVLTGSTDMVTNDSTRRLGATLGLDQQVRISQTWSASLGLRNRRIFENGGDFVQVAPDAAVSPLEKNEDFTSGYVGLGYKTEAMAASARLEARTGSSGETFIGTASVARELTKELSAAGAVRAAVQNGAAGGPQSRQLDARFGASWRPRDTGVIVFNRLDMAAQTNEQGQQRIKFVNNIAANKQFGQRLQITANHGIKYVREEIGPVAAPVTAKGITNLLGFEARYDISRKIDIGMRGSMLVNDKGAMSYAYGPSVGFTPAKNVWVSAGYNLKGFNDDDFAAAEYSREGVYLNLKLKFDQDTLEGLVRKISPNSAAQP